MKFKLRTLLLSLISMVTLTGCNKTSYTKFPSDSLYVKKVNNLSDDFIMGMDASSVIAEENSGVKYYDFDGNETDVFETLSKSGINYIRVRIWNDPYDSNGNGYGGGNNDLATAIAIGKRATQYGMKLLVDFHYSDFWADPSKQMCPKAWVGMNIDQKADALYTYTKNCLTTLKNEGIKIGMVQLGNETNGGNMAGVVTSNSWANVCKLWKAGSRATREVDRKILIALHFTNPEKNENMKNYASKIAYYKLDYDVFGSSYYPYWHGSLENLQETLSYVAKTYNKKVMVLETSYANTTVDTDGWGNTIGTGGFDTKSYPFTVAGQANCVRDVINTVKNTKNGIGVCYWEGTWISVGDTTKGATTESNSLLWEEHGSGWASSYSKTYDPNDAGKYYGGCACDNQAMFDASGHPYESLKVFNLARFGNTNVPKYIDGIEDAELLKYTTDNFTLPENVNVIFNDNSKSPIHVTWTEWVDTTVSSIEEAKNLGNARYTIKGFADGYSDPVYCYLSVMEYNFVQNYSFESGSSNWTRKVNAGTADTESHKITVTNENPQTGSYAYHFWTSDSGGVNFDITQDVNLTQEGIYKLQASFLGGGSGTNALNAAKQNNYLYVKINNTITNSVSHTIGSYSDGYKDELLTNIEVHNGDSVTVGVHIECSEANCWGDIDDVMLNFVSGF